MAAPDSGDPLDPSRSSAPAVPADADAGSGSIDVALSGGTLAVSDGTPAAVGALDSAPVTSGRVVAAVAGEHTARTRSRRITSAAGTALGEGVSKLGSGLGSLGDGVSKLGEASRKVPLVGSSVSALGEGLSQVGESLHDLPRVARTRRGRLMVRSLVVGLLLVASWIAVIVALQLKGNKTPDFRPLAEGILIELSRDAEAIGALYDGSSPRFQEMVRKERFIDDMSDLAATVGEFKEITAVNETLVTSGPTGRVGRVALTVAYAKATCRANVSLHAHEGTWRLLGVAVELPPELEITQAQRLERVQACKDPMAKSCDLFVTANGILEQLRAGKAGDVWDAATSVFRKQEEKKRWVEIQAEHATTLGTYLRIIAVTDARVIGGTSATFDVLTEYTKSQGVRVIFGFYRGSKANPWKLRSFKTVLPMPRADERPAEPVPVPDPSPPPLP